MPDASARSLSAARGSRWARDRPKLLIAVGTVLAGLLLAGAIFYLTLPSVGDAEARVQRVLKAHHGRDSHAVGERVASAVVAVEDERFFSHSAIDFQGTVRALWTGVIHPGVDPGGSTLTQQLAKVLYAGTNTGVLPRLREVGLAFKLEQTNSKHQILEMYLNAVYFGAGYYGIAQAANGYFGLPAGQLNWAQASLLAGLPQAPSAYDPRIHARAARARQRDVLKRMVATHLLTSRQARSIFAEPVLLRH